MRVYYYCCIVLWSWAPSLLNIHNVFSKLKLFPLPSLVTPTNTLYPIPTPLIPSQANSSDTTGTCILITFFTPRLLTFQKPHPRKLRKVWLGRQHERDVRREKVRKLKGMGEKSEGDEGFKPTPCPHRVFCFEIFDVSPTVFLST